MPTWSRAPAGAGPAGIADLRARAAGLAQVEHALGDHDGAEIHFREAIAVTERIGDLGCSAVAWRGLGSIARSDGDHDIALARLRRALAIFGRLDHTSDVAAALIDVAAVAATAGDH